MYQRGLGVRRDFHLAKRHFDLAAESAPEAACWTCRRQKTAGGASAAPAASAPSGFAGPGAAASPSPRAAPPSATWSN